MAPTRGQGGGASFPCPDCDKVFSRKEYMSRHHRSKHAKEKPFVCGYCERGFARSDLLKRHYTTCQEARAQREGGAGDSAGGSGSAAPAGDDAMEEVQETVHSGLPVPPPAFSATTSASPPTTFAPQNTAEAAAGGPLHETFAFPMPPSLGLPPNADPLDPFGSGRRSFMPGGSPNSAVFPPSAGRAGNASGSEGSTASPDFFGTSPAGYSTTSVSSMGETPQTAMGEDSCPPSASSSFTSLPTFSSTSSAPPHNQFQPHPSSIPQPPAGPQHQPLPTLSSTTSAPPGPACSVFTPHSSSSATLAPGLSQTGSFTQDEVLASEVLRDLMKSPQPGAVGAKPGALYPRVLGGAGATVDPGTSGPWHGAKAAAQAAERGEGTAKNEAVCAVGGGPYFDLNSTTGDGGLTPNTALLLSTLTSPIDLSQPVSTKLEDSPAARQLAEYFNKGGTGGITALELGFPTEPSLWPEFMINPPMENSFLHTEEDRRFYVPEQKFCLGYLYPWHVPPLKVLSSYARTATEKLLPSVPVLHSATVDMNEMPTHTAFALTVAGGSYEESGQSFANEMLVEKRVYLVRGFQDPEKTFDDRFASLQSLLLYQLLGLFHRDEQQRLLTQSFHSALIYMLRSLDLPTKIRQTPVPPVTPGMDAQELDAAWKRWVKVETWRRVTFIVFLTDLEHSIASSSAQHLCLSDMDLSLPSSDRLWTASSPTEFQARALSALVPPPISFLSAIRALMARQSPEPFSEQGVLLAELGRLSSFPLLILSRTLSFLERKTEEALAQIDPFKNLLGGLGVVEDREQENRDVLERIRRGREILRKLPGGIARGGGERWFQDVMPTAASFDPSRTSPTSSSPGSSTTSAGLSPSMPISPLDPSTASSLEELLAEFDENQPYKPFYAAGGATGSETYEDAQERMRKHTANRVKDAQAQWTWFASAGV
ncbi:hypothetical protein JCM11251_006841 [Rhodosporidiobolus azoricus]